MSCHLGDFFEYAALRESCPAARRTSPGGPRRERREAAEESWLALRQGDVFWIPAGRRSGPAVVLDHRRQRAARDELRPMVLTGDGHVRRMSIADTSQPVETFTHVNVPKGFVAKDGRARRDLLASAAWPPSPTSRTSSGAGSPPSPTTT